MQSTQPVVYAVVTQAAAQSIKTSRGEVYGFVVISSTAGTITIRDGGSGGTTVLVMTALTAGQVVHFGGVGIICDNDIHVTVGGTADIRVLYV